MSSSPFSASSSTPEAPPLDRAAGALSHDALTALQSRPEVRAAARALVEAVGDAARDAALTPAAYAAALERLGQQRALAPGLPLLAAATGRGARVRLADGREVVDMVSGIGPYVFGHADPDLLETAAIAAAEDVAFQGHVLPGPEYRRMHAVLAEVAGPRLPHAWLALSGSMANENAWKIILQRRAPAHRCLAFRGAFHGRTLAMAALTDRPEYRDGLPATDFVDRVPFYDPRDPSSTRRSLAALEEAIARHPGEHAAMCFELVQGEGGFNEAPASFFEPLMERCRAAGISVWVDEIQTFGRMPELFAFRTLGLEELVDVVTIGKILQGSATLFAADHRPRPKLVAGTWAGASVGLALGARILERLTTQGYLGPDGRIAALEARLSRALDDLDRSLPGAVRMRSGRGAMQAFVAGDGDPERTAEIIAASLDEGALFQTAGRTPLKIRMLPSLDLREDELREAFGALERALRRVGRTRSPVR